MEKDWSKVYTTTDLYTGELVRQVLEDNEIEAVLIDKKGYPYNFGNVELFVHQSNEGKALEIISKDNL